MQYIFSKLRFVFIRNNVSSILSFMRFLNFIFVKAAVDKISSTIAFEIGNVKQDNAYTMQPY